MWRKGGKGTEQVVLIIILSAPTDGYGSGRGFGDGYNGYGGGPGGQFLTYFDLMYF